MVGRKVIGGAVLVDTRISAVMMSQDEVQQIEQHTSMKVEDFSEEQLAAPTRDLSTPG